MTTLITVLIGIIVFLVIIGAFFVYDTLSWGLVLYKFWGWFVLPVFVELPALTFVQALGLMFVIGLFKNRHVGDSIKDEYKKNKNESTWILILSPWVSLLFGWLAYVLFL